MRLRSTPSPWFVLISLGMVGACGGQGTDGSTSANDSTCTPQGVSPSRNYGLPCCDGLAINPGTQTPQIGGGGFALFVPTCQPPPPGCPYSNGSGTAQWGSCEPDNWYCAAPGGDDPGGWVQGGCTYTQGSFQNDTIAALGLPAYCQGNNGAVPPGCYDGWQCNSNGSWTQNGCYGLNTPTPVCNENDWTCDDNGFQMTCAQGAWYYTGDYC